MAKYENIGSLLADYIADFGQGGGIDLADCAVGAICAQTDIEAAAFVENVGKNLPEPLRKIGATLLVRDDSKGSVYGYKIGVDADGVTHEYKGEPIEKLFNIWNFGTADGKIPRTMFIGKAARKLKGKYDRASYRFADILDERFGGKATNAPNSGRNLYEKQQYYKLHRLQYMNGSENKKVITWLHDRKLD